MTCGAVISSEALNCSKLSRLRSGIPIPPCAGDRLIIIIIMIIIIIIIIITTTIIMMMIIVVVIRMVYLHDAP